MKIKKFTLNPIQENTYIVSDNSKNAVIIDPGCYFSEERQLIKHYVETNELKVQAILNTHAHLDHIMGNAFCKREFGVDIYLHRDDLITLEFAGRSALLYGLTGFEESPQPDVFLHDNEVITFGELSFQVIFGPGHAPGHVAFYHKESNSLFGGDILFQGSYGRVDLPGGDYDTLRKTITERIFTLPDETVVYSGHGPETTIGNERLTNPILW